MLLLHPHRLCWALCNWTLLPLRPRAARSAVDLIRLGGGRLRFLVAKSDLDVSEKISASSCWLPLRYDIEKTRDTGLRSDTHEMLVSGVKSSCSTKTNSQRWEKMGLTPPDPLPPPPNSCWHQRERQEEESPNSSVLEVRWASMQCSLL